ncbi:MAG: hypothetical protein FWE31_04850 [Firmicutes bacterium]|nr:hypothetical protein [Bacillota bacterium]
MAKLFQIYDWYFDRIRSSDPAAASILAPNKTTGNKHSRPYLPIFDLSQIDHEALDIDLEGVEPEDIVYFAPLGHKDARIDVWHFQSEIPNSKVPGKRHLIDFKNMIPIKMNSGIAKWYNQDISFTTDNVLEGKAHQKWLEEFLGENLEKYKELGIEIREGYAAGRYHEELMRAIAPFDRLEEYIIKLKKTRGLTKKQYKHRDKEKGQWDLYDINANSKRQMRDLKKGKKGKAPRDRADKYGSQVFYEDMEDEIALIEGWEIPKEAEELIKERDKAPVHEAKEEIGDEYIEPTKDTIVKLERFAVNKFSYKEGSRAKYSRKRDKKCGSSTSSRQNKGPRPLRKDRADKYGSQVFYEDMYEEMEDVEVNNG